MLMRAATVVQVLHGLFHVLLQLFVVAAIILSFIVSFIASYVPSLRRKEASCRYTNPRQLR